MSFRRSCVNFVLFVLLCANTSVAKVYYVDFAHGSDANTGTSEAAAWKHAPGDAAANGRANDVELQPDDMVRFKGGVVYRGSIRNTRSGAKGRPIIYDGNTDGTWGEGRAIISGSVPLRELKRCARAVEAEGSPYYGNIYWTTLPAEANWKTLNVRQGLTPVAWSQDPNPSDPVFQESLADYHHAEPGAVRSHSTIAAEALGDIGENSGRPLIAMFDGTRHSAVIHQMATGAEVKVTLPETVTVASFGITPQPGYVNPKEMSFFANGQEVLHVELAHHPDKTVEQRFELQEPVAFRTLVIRFHSAYQRPGKQEVHFGAVQRVAGYNAEGENVLTARRTYTLRDGNVLTQSDPDYYDNAILALHASPNFVYYKRILDYDPETHTITFEPLSYGQEPGTAYAIVNSPRFLDKPGEYALTAQPDADGSRRLLIWPPDGTPENLSRGQHGVGFSVSRASHVTIQGFWIRKQGWAGSTGVEARGHHSDRETDLVVRDCKVTHLRGSGAGIHVYGVDHTLIDGCEVAFNAGHTKGIVLRNARQQVTRSCRLHKNSSTALDYYTVTGGVVQDCVVTENKGMHANGLTFYVGCKDILIERNVVREGNVGITLQDGENMIIRNNIVEGSRAGTQPVGLWAGRPYNNIVMTNNVFRHYGTDPNDATVGVFGGNQGATGYAIFNNIIDGISGNILLKADMHHNIFTRTGPAMTEGQLGDNLLVPDLDSLYVNAEAHDYRPKPGSLAIDKGVPLTSLNTYDIEGVSRPKGEAIDIGPYEFVPIGESAEGTPAKADPHTWRFSFDGYEIAPPPEFKLEHEPRFERREGVAAIVVRGADFTAEGGGEVRRRTNRGGYTAGWYTPGHWLEWTIDAPEAGAYEVVIVHGSETPSTRKVFLNGEPVEGLQEVSFPATGGWTVWGETGLESPLVMRRGENRVRFEYAGGHLNFKSIEFVPVVTE